ncbi:MAG: hypothetical protein A3J79_04665 [Elusimicrobia bacterium RIFOXYB2_FULL_62_6]|nr:MAG: hypothetical protein A3J79_04665 [Elusimicrobia bacterium RIFOXYB2_FULL_62_6]
MKNIKYLLISAFILCATGASAADKKSNFVLFLSDFGTKDDSVSQCKGVVLSLNPETQVIDLTHEIPPFDTHFASFVLYDSAKVWPAGSVFLAVVDPGVGTARNPILLETKSGHFFIGPDNGIFTMPAEKLGVKRIIRLDNKEYFRTQLTSTFQGRDLFASVAGWVSKPGFDPAKLGAELPVMEKLQLIEPVVAPTAIIGQVMRIEEPYGNIWTNITEADVTKAGLTPGTSLYLELEGEDMELPYKSTFGDVEKGAPLAYINSRGYLSLAVNMGNFSEVYGITAGRPLRLFLFSVE